MQSSGELDPARRRLCRGWAAELDRRDGVVADPEERPAIRRALVALLAFEGGLKAHDDGCTRAIALLDRRSIRILGEVFRPGVAR